MNTTLIAQFFNLIVLLCVIAAVIGFIIYFFKTRITVFRNIDRIASELTKIRTILEENKKPIDK